VATKKGWTWKLSWLPIIAVAVLVGVLLYGAGVLDVTALGDGVRVFHIVLVGVLVFLVLLAIETVLLVRTFADDAPVELEEDAPAPPEPGPEPEPDAPAFAPPPVAGADAVEAVVTADHYDGRNVLEVARPPKSAVEGGIYASTYIPVNGSFMLRLEELVAVHERA
jgi:hypothetical protein